MGRIALVMCLSCASAGLTQTFVSGLVQIYKRDATINANEIANALLSGLVAVTGCCPFIDPRFAVLIGGKDKASPCVIQGKKVDIKIATLLKVHVVSSCCIYL